MRLGHAVLLIAIGLVAAATLAACGASATEVPPASQPTLAATGAPAPDGAALLEARCSGCHPASRAKEAIKTAEEWTQTVTRMIGKGAKLDDAEKAALIDYLAKTYGP